MHDTRVNVNVLEDRKAKISALTTALNNKNTNTCTICNAGIQQAQYSWLKTLNRTLTHLSHYSAKTVQFLSQFIVQWRWRKRWRCGSAGTGIAFDLRLVGREFKSYSGQRCVTTLGKLFTPMCLCNHAV